MTRNVIVLGAGGHAKVLIDAMQHRSMRIMGILDTEAANQGKEILGVPIIGNDDKLSNWKSDEVILVNALGSIDKPIKRAEIYTRMHERGFSFLGVIHPGAIVSSHANLSEGAQIMAGAVIQVGAQLSENCLINTGARVDHDCVIGRHVHVAPGVTLSGNVTIGDQTHIGTGATIIQGIRIGHDCLIAAGAVVIHDVPDGARMAGIPAVRI